MNIWLVHNQYIQDTIADKADMKLSWGLGVI